MKTVDYWDKKRDAVLRAIEQFDRIGPSRGHRPSPRKGKMTHYVWRTQYESWLVSEKTSRAFADRRAKLARRLAYIEERIRVTAPTFWSKL